MSDHLLLKFLKKIDNLINNLNNKFGFKGNLGNKCLLNKILKKAISVLKQRFGNSLSTSKSILGQHTHTTSIIKSELPDAVIFPENKNDILEIVNVAQNTNVLLYHLQ